MRETALEVFTGSRIMSPYRLAEVRGYLGTLENENTILCRFKSFGAASALRISNGM
jgi:hypothetical protein